MMGKREGGTFGPALLQVRACLFTKYPFTAFLVPIYFVQLKDTAISLEFKVTSAFLAQGP